MGTVYSSIELVQIGDRGLTVQKKMTNDRHVADDMVIDEKLVDTKIKKTPNLDAKECSYGDDSVDDSDDIKTYDSEKGTVSSATTTSSLNFNNNLGEINSYFTLSSTNICMDHHTSLTNITNGFKDDDKINPDWSQNKDVSDVRSIGSHYDDKSLTPATTIISSSSTSPYRTSISEDPPLMPSEVQSSKSDCSKVKSLSSANDCNHDDCINVLDKKLKKSKSSSLAASGYPEINPSAIVTGCNRRVFRRQKDNRCYKESRIPVLDKPYRNDKITPPLLLHKFRSVSGLSYPRNEQNHSEEEAEEGKEEYSTTEGVEDEEEEFQDSSSKTYSETIYDDFVEQDELNLEPFCGHCRFLLQTYINNGLLCVPSSQTSEPDFQQKLANNIRYMFRNVPLIKNLLDYLDTCEDLPYIRSFCLSVAMAVLSIEFGKRLTRMLITAIFPNVDDNIDVPIGDEIYD